MPRPKKPGAPEPKRRSRNGCWPCKARKVKCGEEKPQCTNCERQGETCDYSIRLNWGGRVKKKTDSDSVSPPQSRSGTHSPHASISSLPDLPRSQHFRSRSANAVVESGSEGLHHASFSPYTTPLSLQSLSSPYDLHDRSQRAMASALRGATSTPIEQLQHQNGLYRPEADYPSPSTSSMEGSLYTSATTSSSVRFLSPTSNPMAPDSPRTPASQLSLMRPHSSHSMDPPLLYFSQPPSTSTSSITYSLAMVDPFYVSHGPPTPESPFMGAPLTPNSTATEEVPAAISMPPPPCIPLKNSADLRRMSVNSLLCETGHQYPIADASFTTYGYDLGEMDLDIPNNVDSNAIHLFSPPASYESSIGRRQSVIAFESGGYYAKPVLIKISKLLEPLPQKLLDNPMNLLYFHHFLNHTARILVPHDCDQNPFRNILPQMAVRDENLLNLFLAFSASHRARLLNHPEPKTRIATWMQDVFPTMRQALLNSHRPISDATLATSIMLASLEIISPNAFEVSISWQDHLHMARQFIVARGGHQSLKQCDRVGSFLCRWFDYLDVIGSLSASKNELPLSLAYWTPDAPQSSIDEPFQIDCLLGFTPRCISILAKISEMAKTCNTSRFDQDGNVRRGWQPTESVRVAAEKLKFDLNHSRTNVMQRCSHRFSSASNSDSQEIYATNDAFHWAGLIHLCRRVLGKSSSDPELQHAIHEIISNLYKIRKGSSAEACLLFPMFTAGCDAIDSYQRSRILERLSAVEGFGMMQVIRARALMQQVWQTGKPWETLVENEFFG